MIEWNNPADARSCSRLAGGGDPYVHWGVFRPLLNWGDDARGVKAAGQQA